MYLRMLSRLADVHSTAIVRAAATSIARRTAPDATAQIQPCPRKIRQVGTSQKHFEMPINTMYVFVHCKGVKRLVCLIEVW